MPFLPGGLSHTIQRIYNPNLFTYNPSFGTLTRAMYHCVFRFPSMFEQHVGILMHSGRRKAGQTINGV